ncbi:MAG: alkaline phosphatase family protein [Candidatus Cybelea sp.]
MRWRALGLTALAAAALAACGGSSVPARLQRAPEYRRASSSATPIQHVVLVIQENRTFNNFFATYPGADGTTTGAARRDRRCHIGKNKTIALTEMGLVGDRDFNHSYQGYRAARNGGKMNGFDQILASDGRPECAYPYQYVDPSEIRPYWDIAKAYVLAEHMFTTQGSSSFTGHQDLIAGGTIVAPNEAMVNLPSCSGHTCRWGCDAPPGTHTSLISSTDSFAPGKGPFPCTNDFASNYPTLRDLLDAKGVSWKYYAPPICCNTNGRLFTAFDVIAAVRYGPEWKTNMSSPQTNVFSDITYGTLPAVSWLIPDEPDSDHPGEKIDTGPSWVASVVNAIGTSQYWNSTAIVIVWDDWGGFYDNLNPHQVGYGGLGFRVPALVVSAYAKPGFISTTNYEFGSILKYIEKNWNLGSLGTSDKRAKSIIDCFDYSQPPLQFTPIPSQYSKTYFIARKPSFSPPDTDF